MFGRVKANDCLFTTEKVTNYNHVESYDRNRKHESRYKK